MPLWNLRDDYSPSMTVQYPDLTEIARVDGLQYCTAQRLLEEVKTEFVFTIQAPSTQNLTHELIRHGFTQVSSMRNYYRSHPEERRLNFWWKRVHPNAEPQKSGRISWGGSEEGGYFSHGGCGFKLNNKLHKAFKKFFSLLRMPLDPTKFQLQWLKINNYRLIEKGNMASFYVNGFDPDTYSFQTEADYWRKVEEEDAKKRAAKGKSRSIPAKRIAA